MPGTGIIQFSHLPESGCAGQFDGFRMSTYTGTHQPASRPCILLLSVSAGNGHVRAAEAIEAHAKINFPDIEIVHCDVMQLMPVWFRKVYTDWYIKLTGKFPELWGWLYRITDTNKNNWIRAIRKKLEQSCSYGLFRKIAEINPDAIICTHFLPAELLSDSKKHNQQACPVWIQVTDLDLHRMWVHSAISGYFVATDELAYRLHSYGIDRDHICVSGIPVMPGFTASLSRNALAKHYGIDPSITTVMMMGGGAGIGDMEALAKRLLEMEQNFQLIVLAGKNKQLLSSLQSLSAFFPKKLFTIGFTQEVHALMACSDLVITKPGGLSTTECLVMGAPMLLVNPIPGQEERNAAYLLQEGAAIRADDPDTLIFRLQDLLNNQSRLSTMRDRARQLARPDAARMVLDRVITSLPVKKFYEATRCG